MTEGQTSEAPPPEADGPDDAPAGRLSVERAARLAKLEASRAQGVEPYPYRFDRSETLSELRATHGGLPPGTETEERVRVAGRVVLLRRQGKLTFATLRDRDGEVQLFVSRSVLGDAHEQFDDLDLGDWVGVEGTVMTTRKGELSVKVETFELLAKALRPLPDKWRGLSDVDTRYRQRYVDLIVNEEARRSFAVRHAVVASLRRSLDDAGLRRGGDAGAARRGGRRPRPAVRHATTTPSTWSCTSASRSSCTSSGSSSVASSASTRSAGSSATRASRRGTTPSSRCSRPTRPSPTTTT